MTNKLPFFFLTGLALSGATLEAAHMIRAAIDIGMGGPKLHVAEVDPESGRIVHMLHSQRYFVNFHEGLSHTAHPMLSTEIMQKGRRAFLEAVAQAHACKAEGIVAIATAALRSAANGEQFAHALQEETGVQVHIIDQELEGRLAFQAAAAKTNIDPRNLVVWDIGGGSIQFVMAAADGSHRVDCGEEGAGAFANHIIEKIQHKKLKEFPSPNPMSPDDIFLATAHAHNLSQKVDVAFRNKISDPHTTMVGAGSVFGFGISAIVDGKNPFSLEDLAAAVQTLPGKTDADLGGGDYAFCKGTNAILALGFMRGLNIQKIHILNINNADGALVDRDFWR